MKQTTNNRRDFKFRAWDNKSKCFVKPPEYTFIASSYGTLAAKATLPETDTDYPSFREFELQQFTGLKDKNGKEIYEGDIVNAIGDYDEIEHTGAIKYYVNDDYPAFDFDPYAQVDSNGLSHYIATGRLEVIGNIYENKDLLK